MRFAYRAGVGWPSVSSLISPKTKIGLSVAFAMFTMFTMLTMFTILTMSATSSWAQGGTAAQVDCSQRKLSTQVVQVRYKPVSEAALLVNQLLGECGAYRVPKSLRMITVEDEPQRIAQIVEAVASWDTPPRAVDVTVSLVLATREPPPRNQSAQAGIADEIRGVSRTLSELTNYTRFERLATVSVQSFEGGEAVVDLGEMYQVAFSVEHVDPGRAIVFDPFQLKRRMASGEVSSSSRNTPRTLLSMSLNLPPGQLHIVGAPSRARDRALFLALESWAREPAAVEPAAAVGAEE